MDYQEFLDDITALEFVTDADTADVAIKTVLGMMAGNLSPEEARNMSAALPAPFDIESLRKPGAPAAVVTFDECILRVSRRFQLELEDARALVEAVLRSTRAALGGDKLGEVEDVLSDSWRSAIDHA